MRWLSAEVIRYYHTACSSIVQHGSGHRTMCEGLISPGLESKIIATLRPEQG